MRRSSGTTTAYIFCYVIGYLMSFIQQSRGQFIYQQSDRMQILYYDVITSKLTDGHRDTTVSFAKPFLNIPKITFSVLWYYSSISGTQGFSIDDFSVATDNVVVRVTTKGVDIYNLRIGILATDYPNQITYTDSVSSGSQDNAYSSPGNILGYAAFFTGYKGTMWAGIELHFDFQVTKASNTSVNVHCNSSGFYMSGIEYNVLIIYDSNTFDSLLYSFLLTVSQNFKVLEFQTQTFNVQTQLSNTDRVLYGFRYYSMRSREVYKPKVETKDMNFPILDGNVKLIMTSTQGTIDDGDILVFQLIMRTCPQGRYVIKQNGQYQCTSSCSSINMQTYNDPNNKFILDYDTYDMRQCSTCNPACYGCTGPNNTDCTSCMSGMYFNINQCTSTQPSKTYCPSQTIDSQVFLNCQPCHPSCLTCSGPGANECTSCEPDFKFSYQGQCLSSEIDGIYCDEAQLKCFDCAVQNCKVCNSTLDVCSSCISNNYLYKNICYNTIQNGSYCDANNICNDCDYTSCVNCKDTADFCTSCSSGLLLLDNKCLSQQPDFTYCSQQAPDEFMTCVHCPDNCISCTGDQDNQCTVCKAGKYFLNGTCSDAKPATCFCDQNLICTSCEPSCQECTGPDSTECTQCYSNVYFYKNTCSNTQTFATWCDANLVCNDCSTECRTCQDAPDVCTSCIAGKYLFNSKCFDNQQDSSFCIEDNTLLYFQCQSCSTNCLKCTGSNPNECTVCENGKYFYNNQCFDARPPSTYNDNQLICYDCDPTCRECTGPSDQECLACYGIYLYHQKCINPQIDGTYCDANKVCKDCDLSKCVTCVDSEDKCLSCQTDQYLFANTCYQTYPDSAFCQQLTNPYFECQSCSSNCYNCQVAGSNSCDQCLPTFYFYKNACTAAQPPSTFCDASLICSPCNPKCKECTGDETYQCTQCYDGTYLKTDTHTCETCQKGCTKCNTFSECTECTNEYIYDSSISQCIKHCTSDAYFNEITRECTPCHPNCLTCDNISQTSCLSCISAATLTITGQCECTSISYGFSADGKACEQCNVSNCQNCYNSPHCDSCMEHAEYQSSINECVCIEGFYLSSGKCVICPQKNCQACSVDGSQCTKCLPGILLSSYGTCDYCNNFKYATQSSNACNQDCPRLCQVCSNGQSCLMYDKDDPFNIPIELCEITCKRCSGLTSKDCLECSSDTRQYNLQTSLCECKTNYKEVNKQDCEKISQVEEMIIDFHQKLNVISFPIHSASILFNLSPAVTYSYILQQLVGDLSYVKHDKPSTDHVLIFYTKYNLNNIYSLNSAKTNSSEDDQSSLKIGRILDNQNLQNQQNISSQQDGDIVGERNTLFEVDKENRFFYASCIPLATTILLFLISALIHIYEVSRKCILKFGCIFKWNSLILSTQINSNFMIVTLLNCNFGKQEMRDIICAILFCSIYAIQLIWIFKNVRSDQQLEKSYTIIESYYDRSKFIGRYYFFIVELKKIVFSLVIIVTIQNIRFTIWGLIGYLMLELVLIRWSNPFKQQLDLYATVALDIIFCLIMSIFGVLLNSTDNSQAVTFVTFILILLIIFTLITLSLIIYRFLQLIRNFRNKIDTNDKLIESNYTSTTLSHSFNQELQFVSAHVKWQKNPICKRPSTSSLK